MSNKTITEKPIQAVEIRKSAKKEGIYALVLTQEIITKYEGGGIGGFTSFVGESDGFSSTRQMLLNFKEDKLVMKGKGKTASIDVEATAEALQLELENTKGAGFLTEGARIVRVRSYEPLYEGQAPCSIDTAPSAKSGLEYEIADGRYVLLHEGQQYYQLYMLAVDGDADVDMFVEKKAGVASTRTASAPAPEATTATRARVRPTV